MQQFRLEEKIFHKAHTVQLSYYKVSKRLQSNEKKICSQQTFA